MAHPDQQPERPAASRRDFIKRTALGAAALGLPGRSIWQPSPLASPIKRRQEERLGYALVGLGNYATYQLAPALQQTQHCYLAGIVTGTPEKAERWKAQYNIPERNIYSYDTFDEIAGNPDIDIVYVVLPNSMHAEYTIRAAQAGKHVLSEKPMAISVAECEAMIAACEAANVHLGVGYRLHFEPHNREVMRIGQEKVFGNIKAVEAGYGFRIGDPAQWRLRKALAGGGALMDVGIYAIQAARYTTGEEPVSLTAQEVKTDPEKFAEVDETLFWQMKFPSGAVSTHTTTYAAYVERLYAAAERGWVELSPAYSYGGLAGRSSQGPLNFPQVYEQALQMDDFAECVATGRKHRASGEMGLQDMKIIEAIYRAVESGGSVEIG